MKWFFGINDRATGSLLGDDAKRAVVSAQRNTTLQPHLLYYGSDNDFTDWMQRRGVVVHRPAPSLERLIYDLEARGTYSSNYMGHWLRAEICQIERDSDCVLYTDCDVVFLSEPEGLSKPEKPIACAPEFRTHEWNYFNSGVMLMNVPLLREDFPQFIGCAKDILERAKGSIYNDQFAYNQFYRNRWDRLAVENNWKPYWNPNPDAKIVHFHGPKLGVIRSVLNGEWNWDSPHGSQLGSLLTGHELGYRAALVATCNALQGTGAEAEVEEVLGLFDRRFAALPKHRVDLGFMNFRLFPDQT